MPTRVRWSHRKTLATLLFLLDRISSCTLDALFTFATWPEVFIFPRGSSPPPPHNPSSIFTSLEIMETKEQFSKCHEWSCIHPTKEMKAKAKEKGSCLELWKSVRNSTRVLIKLKGAFRKFIASRITLYRQWILQDNYARVCQHFFDVRYIQFDKSWIQTKGNALWKQRRS